MMEASIENNKQLANLNDKLLEKTNERVIIASYLLSPLSKITNPEHASQPKLVKNPQSNRFNDLLINETKPVTLYDHLLTFRGADKKFKLQGDLSKLVTNRNYNFDLAKLSDKKLMFDFEKDTSFEENALSSKSTRDKSLTRLNQSPAITASGISTIFLPENHN